MRRTNIIELKPSKIQIKILKECMLLSSCVYNQANYIIRQESLNGQRLSTFRRLQSQIQQSPNYLLLGRVYGLPRLQQYSETIASRFNLIKSKTQKYVNLPKYLKNRKTNTTLPSYLVMDGCQHKIGKSQVTIPLSHIMRKKYNMLPNSAFKVKYTGVLKHKGTQQRGEIHFKNHKFYLHQAVEIVDIPPKNTNIVAGLDLGIKNIISCITNNNKDLIIGSNRFFRQWKYLTDNISKEKSKIDLTNLLFTNHLSKTNYKRAIYQNNLFNNVVAKLFRFLNRNNVSKLVIGDVKGIMDKDRGKKCNQMINNYWSFDKLLKKINNKAEEFGIEVIMTTEEYTSRTCPICFDNSKSNCHDRIFECNFCGFIDHRDIVGARNIMLKGMNDLRNGSVHWCEIVPLEVL